MLPIEPIDPDTKIDFYAGSDSSFSALKSLYQALDDDRRGTFYASPSVSEDGIDLKRIRGNRFDGDAPLVVSSYRDLNAIFISCDDRPFIMLEREYVRETRGLINAVALFLCGEKKGYDFRRINAKNVQFFETDQDALAKLLEYVKGKEIKHITEVGKSSVGLMYMAWGEKAEKAINRSIKSLKRLGYSYPVAVVGDIYERKFNGWHDLIPWKGQSPFDASKQHNFQFRAGRIKPFLGQLSPFDYTLYIDADTQFIQPVHDGFELLNEYDLVVTEENLSLAQLYNKKLAGWEINLIERDTTIVELGGDDAQKFINSGVMFFRKNKKTLKLFADWHSEWLRFQEWDEQLALMRAIYRNPKVKVLRLPVQWNNPKMDSETIIFHDYGHGSVRHNAE